MDRRIAGILLAVLAASLIPSATRAADSPPSVAIHVADTRKAAVAGAAVFLVGGSEGRNAVAVTDRSGTAVISSIPAGMYRLVVRKSGYAEASGTVEVGDLKETVVSVELQPLLTTVATVRSNISAFTRPLTTADTVARLSKNLFDALEELGGVTISRRNGKMQGIAIDGHDTSATAVAFDGVNIADPMATHALDPDLLEGIRVSQFDDAVDLLFLSPTVSPQYSMTGTLGGFGYSAEKVSAQGRFGALGYAGVLTHRRGESALDGAVYEDTSGLTYRHDGSAEGTSVYGVVTVPLGVNWTAAIRAIGGAEHSLPIPTYYAGPLPYGMGPGNDESGTSRDLITQITGTLSDALVAIAASDARTVETISDAHRIEAGQPEPLIENGRSEGRTLSVDVAFTDSHVSNVMVTLSSKRGTTRFAPQALSYLDRFGEGSSSSMVLTVKRDALLAGKYHAQLEADAVRVAGERGALGLSLAPEWSRARTHVRLRFGTVARDAETIGGGAFSDPSSAQFDCAADAIFANAPSAPGAPVVADVVQLSIDQQMPRGTLGLYAYDESYRGVTLSGASVPAAAEPSGFLPAGYIASLQAAYNIVGACPGAPPDASQIFLQHDIDGLNVLYRGLDLRWTRIVGSRGSLQGFVDWNQAVLGSDPRLIYPTSLYIPGSQIPFVPPWKAGIAAAWLLGDGRTRLMTMGEYVSRNNQNNLPPYMMWSVGTERTLSPAAVVDIVARNVGNRDTGLFSSPRLAVPLPLAGGGTLLENAAPLPQPDVFLSLSLRLQNDGT
jgi:hypothetical protein